METDICIIGAGPIGLAIAHALLDAPVRVTLLEAGGERPTTRGQDFLWAERAGTKNHSYAFSRLRAYGGSSLWWSGVCPKLEESDFAPTAMSPGWPIAPQILEPWLKSAASLLDLASPETTPEAWTGQLGPPPPLGASVRPVVLPVSRRKDLGAFMRGILVRSPRVRVVLNANVSALDTNETASCVRSARILLPGGRVARCRARNFVLAAGGIENARLLLLSDDVAPAGLGNARDLVGRYFMDHPYCYAGRFVPATPNAGRGPHVVRDFSKLDAGPAAILAFTLPEAERHQAGLNGAAAFLMERREFQLHPDYDSPGGEALAYGAELLRGQRFLDRSAPGMLGHLVRHAPAALRTIVRHGVDMVRPRPQVAVRMQSEARPQANSRVSLSRDRDAHGRRRALVTWRVSDDDVLGPARLWRSLDAEFRAAGLGRLEGDGPDPTRGWPASTIGGKHHMGTTRMANDPRLGVVDEACRVHGIENLYVAGSSVFPTSGWANPTRTAMALALRLADQLRDDFG